MKHQHSTTEELLTTGKQYSLSTDEHAEIKASLLSYAQFHGGAATTAAATVSPWYHQLWVRTVALASLVIVVSGGTATASVHSLPGEPLYAMKVHVVEEIVAFTKFDDESEMAFTVERLENRVAELQVLKASATLSVAALEIAEAAMTDHVALLSGQASEETTSVDPFRVLEFTGDAIALTQAAEVLATEVTTDNEQSFFEATVDEAESLHEDEFAHMVSDLGAVGVETYVSMQLAEIADEFAEADVSEVTLARVQAYLDDANEAIVDQATSSAATLIDEALQTLETDDYVAEFEEERNES